MEAKKQSLLWADFECHKCGKPILGQKCMKIRNKHYHMVCGLSVAIEKRIIEAKG